MIECAAFEDDLEKTQALPVLTPALLRDASLGLPQVTSQRRASQGSASATMAEFAECDFTTEGALFEVCGSLQDALAMVLGECRARGIELTSGSAASHALEAACDRLDRALSAPGFAASDRRVPVLEMPLLTDSRTTRRELCA